MPHAVSMVVTAAERTILERWARGRRRPPRLVRRARIVLAAAAGQPTAAIARTLKTDRNCVKRWCARFARDRLAGLQREAARSGRPPAIAADLLQAIVTQTTTTTPAGRPCWTTRTLARAVQVSPQTVHRVWQANGLTPGWVRRQCLGKADRDLEGLDLVVGGYLTPLESALLLVGPYRYPGVQRPPARGRPRRRARPVAGARIPGDIPPRYAGLHLPTGYVIGWAPELSRHRDWLDFLDRLAARLPANLEVHVLADNPASHQHPEVQRWFARHPAVHLHLVRGDRPVPRRVVEALRTAIRLPAAADPRRERPTLRALVDALRPLRARRRMPVAWLADRELLRTRAKPWLSRRRHRR